MVLTIIGPRLFQIGMMLNNNPIKFSNVESLSRYRVTQIVIKKIVYMYFLKYKLYYNHHGTFF